MSKANTFEGDDEEDEKYAERGKSTDKDKDDTAADTAMDVEDADTSIGASPSGKAGGGKGSKKGAAKNVNVRGAMDDYFEDVAIEKFKAGDDADAQHDGEADVASSSSSSAVAGAHGGKRTKRKLVEKFFQDEKGYFVTEQVWEEVTDDESEPAPTGGAGTKRGSPGDVKENVPAASDKAASKPAPAKKPKPAAAPVAQKSMTSFFTKKG